jgi:hypothetical protein
MQYLLFGLIALALFLIGARTLASANPAVLARQIRVGAGIAALAGGGVLALRGATAYGLWLAAAGSWLIWGHHAWQRMTRAASPPAASGSSSRIATDHLDVELDHETGDIRGHVRRGFFAGRALETLKPVELAHLWSDCRFDDPASAQIVEAYLDRIHPTWREDMAARTEHSAGTRPPRRDDGRMSREEALGILGLTAGASDDDIRRAHRELMLKLHPDRGGSHTLAATVNEAKDVLLGH